MTVALYIISILWIASGAFLVLYTESAKEFLKRLLLRDHLRWLAVLPAIFGIILVVGAFSHKEMFWLALVLGVLGLIKGVYWAIGPSAQIKRLLEWWFYKAGDRTIRLHGLIAVVLGSAILSYL